MMRIRVWDLPTRLFHWGLVLAVAITFIPAGDDAWLRLHVTTGFVVLGLILFRLAWGFIGNRYALFSSFVRPWRDVQNYLAVLFGPNRIRFIGHNPVAGWMVLSLLGIILLICLTGILVFGGEEGRGPLGGLLPYTWGVTIKEVHAVASYIFLGMIGIHVAGVFAESLLHHENLLKAMWTGDKEVEPAQSAEATYPEAPASRITSALVALYLVGGATFALVVYFYKPPPPPILYQHAAWQKECSACHMAFPPLLLPESSWRRIMADLGNHFGDDASLDPTTADDITAFLVSHAAERSQTEAAQKILSSLRPDEIPLRITDTSYWIRKHQEIDKATYQRKSVGSRLNCVACHRWADRGSFEDEDIRIPPA
jgi:cytochrome b